VALRVGCAHGLLPNFFIHLRYGKGTMQQDHHHHADQPLNEPLVNLDEVAEDLVDMALAKPLHERPPEVQSLLSDEVPVGGKRLELHGSGATDTDDPVRLAQQDNTRAFNPPTTRRRVDPHEKRGHL
jgi:hypothetical protein